MPSPSRMSSPQSYSTGERTHGTRNSIPQSYKDNNNSAQQHNNNAQDQSEAQQQLEYDNLILSTSSPSIRPKKNCCTWKIASLFLVCVAVGLVVVWVILPAEDIVAKYIPQFDEPDNPYQGPEAGDEKQTTWGDIDNTNSQDGSGNGGGISIGMPGEEDVNNDSGLIVPSFMTCPSNKEFRMTAEGDELCCNGSVSNCKLRVNEMMFGMVHNAMSSEEGGFFIGYNHKLGLEKALVAGYRGLNLDVCNCNGVLQFCHNVCDLGERMPNEVFTNTLQFLNDYPSEVIVLLFQASQDQGPIVWDDLYAEMNNVDGFTDMIYVHQYGNEWPLMSDLVQQNKRIIVFYFNGGTCTSGMSACPTGFNYFFNYAAETQFESASIADLENYEYSCEVTRGPQDDALPAAFFVVNNFVTPPDPEAAKITNSKTFLSNRLTNCANLNKQRPNFVYLDFWSEGVTSQLVQFANTQFAEQSRTS